MKSLLWSCSREAPRYSHKVIIIVFITGQLLIVDDFILFEQRRAVQHEKPAPSNTVRVVIARYMIPNKFR
ncbi:hypothetical protein AB9M62_36640 [Bacillales bacterium AN1005]